MWTISNKQWVVFELRWFPFKKSIRLIFFFSNEGQAHYRYEYYKRHCPWRKRTPSTSALRTGLGFSCSHSVPGEETKRQTPGYTNNGFFSTELCGHFITLHFSMQTISVLNILIWDLPSTFPKWLFRYVTPITRIRMQ